MLLKSISSVWNWTFVWKRRWTKRFMLIWKYANIDASRVPPKTNDSALDFALVEECCPLLHSDAIHLFTLFSGLWFDLDVAIFLTMHSFLQDNKVIIVFQLFFFFFIPLQSANDYTKRICIIQMCRCCKSLYFFRFVLIWAFWIAHYFQPAVVFLKVAWHYFKKDLAVLLSHVNTVDICRSVATLLFLYSNRSHCQSSLGSWTFPQEPLETAGDFMVANMPPNPPQLSPRRPAPC